MADALTQKVIFTMVDAAGKEGTTSLQVPTSGSSDPTTGVLGYVSVLNAASNAKVVRLVGQTANNEAHGTAVANVYDVRDKLAVEYVGSQNDHHIMMVGDLNPSILDASNMETVNPTNALWLTLKSAIESNVVDKAGNNVRVIRGFRTRSKNLKTSMRFL